MQWCQKSWIIAQKSLAILLQVKYMHEILVPYVSGFTLERSGSLYTLLDQKKWSFYVQCESKNSPAAVFWHFFQTVQNFQSVFLHTYYTFLSTQWCLCPCDRGRDEKCSPGQRFTDDDLLPKAVEALRGKHIVDVCVGPSHFLALTKSGAVYSWGCNDHGQLGHHDNSTKGVVARPSRVNTPTVAVGCRVAVHCGPLQVSSLLTVADLILFTVILSSLIPSSYIWPHLSYGLVRSKREYYDNCSLVFLLCSFL